MFDKRPQYSYREQKYQRTRYYKFIFGFFIFYIIYNCFTAFVFSVWVMDNNTMQPALAAGDRMIFTSLNPSAWFSRVKSDERPFPYKRGSIVLVDMGKVKEKNIPLKLIDGAVRFFTAQQVSIFSNERQYYLKRVIALPGDEIYMNNYVFRVKPAGSSYNLTEFELADKPYHPAIPQPHELWDESIPFSGSMDAITLGPDECFVVSDDRGNTNDSRTWGPVSPSIITSRAVLRFWPVKKIGLF
ncbi:MAG: signal peptidase I [Treponema sp.]|jgi:signal peptidase I|nr:signal peptidase I [Treponema sp.]